MAAVLVASPFLNAQEQDRAQIRLNAISLERQGRNAEAEELWSAIAKSDEHNAEAYAHLGLLEQRQEHLETAIDNYRRAASIDSNLPGLQMNLGLALFKAAQFPDAIKSFTAEIKKHPGDLRLTILLGMAHFGMKDYLLAIPYLMRATERDPQNFALRTTLAQSCLWSKQYTCVVKVQQQLLSLNEESAQVDILAAEALDQMQRSDAAMKALQAASLANPMEPHLHFALGYLLWAQNKWEDAAREFDLELQADAHNQLADIYRVNSWVQRNDTAKALPQLEALNTREQSNPMVHVDLAIIYANSGRTEDAGREIGMAIALDPGNADLHLQAAKLYQSIGRSVQANAETEMARKLPPPSHPSLQELMESVETPAS